MFTHRRANCKKEGDYRREHLPRLERSIRRIRVMWAEERTAPGIKQRNFWFNPQEDCGHTAV